MVATKAEAISATVIYIHVQPRDNLGALFADPVGAAQDFLQVTDLHRFLN